MITVAEYNHASQLEPFASLWGRILDRTPEYCPSHAWEWLNSQIGSEDLKLRILVAFLGGKPFGILPLKVETRVSPLGTLRCLTSIGEPFLPFAGPLGPNTTAMLAAAFRHIHRTRRDWDMVEFRLGENSPMLRQRLQNAFRLIGWPGDMEPGGDGLEVRPESVAIDEFSRQFDVHFSPSRDLTFTRSGAAEPLSGCLSLVEEIRGSIVARQLRTLHQAYSIDSLPEWCLLQEQGTAFATAMSLVAPGGVRTVALVARSELASLQLLRRMLEDGLWRGDGPYLLPMSDVPLPERWTNATRRGFRYTHLSPWAIRARWLRFRERLQTVRATEPVAETEIAPAPRMLRLYSP